MDLVNQQASRDLFASDKPDTVLLAAAKVGVIHADITLPTEFINENMMIAF